MTLSLGPVRAGASDKRAPVVAPVVIGAPGGWQ